MPWIYAIVGLLVGCVVGIIIAKITTPQYKNQKSLQKELTDAKIEMDQQRQELMDHFSQTAEMLDTIGKDYTKLYQHLAKTSAELLPNLSQHDNPFTKTAAKHADKQLPKDDTGNDEPPKDYAAGPTGLLENEEMEIIHSKDVINAQAS